MDAPSPAGKSATTAITNYIVCLAREGGAKHICFLLALRTETHVLPKTFKDVAKLPADSKKRWLESCLEELKSVTNFIRPYLHQFFIDSHGLNGYGKPLKRPFNRY